MQFHAKILTPARAIEDITVEAAGEAEARQLIASNGGRLIELRAGRSSMSGRAPRRDFNLAVFNQQMHSLLPAIHAPFLGFRRQFGRHQGCRRRPDRGRRDRCAGTERPQGRQ